MGKAEKRAEQERRRAKGKADCLRAVLYCRLPTNARLLWLFLLDMQGKKPDAWPSENTIAKLLKWSKRTTQIWVAYLEKAGIIHVSRRLGRSSRYAVANPLKLLDADGNLVSPEQYWNPNAACGDTSAVAPTGADSCAGTGAETCAGGGETGAETCARVAQDPAPSSAETCAGVAQKPAHRTVSVNGIIERNQERPAVPAGDVRTSSGRKDKPIGATIGCTGALEGLADKTAHHLAEGICKLLCLGGGDASLVRQGVSQEVRSRLAEANGKAEAVGSQLVAAARAARQRCTTNGPTAAIECMDLWREMLPNKLVAVVA